MTPLDSQIVEIVRSAAWSEDHGAYLRRVLTKLVAINTAPEADLDASRQREQALFDAVEREIRDAIDGQVRFERPAIDPAIANDPVYSLPGYAANGQGTIPPPEEVYAGRSNFLAIVSGEDEGVPPAAILHAHIDVVSPWFGPRVEGTRLYGRGACDNKSQIAAILGQLRLMREVTARAGRRPRRGFVIQLTLDEEIGGNGSASMVRDPRFAGVPVIMLDASDLVPYCAHRGAVYYRCRLSASSHPRTSGLEILPFVVLELETEGRRIARETNYDLFNQRHIQTNQGIVGRFGRHPGSVCDHVAFEITVGSPSNSRAIQRQVLQSISEGLQEYLDLYGDKRLATDPATGRPKVERHFDLRSERALGIGSFRLDVWGKSGHMAAVRDCDNAITKAAWMLRGVLQVHKTYPDARIDIRFGDVHDTTDVHAVELQGGQGFAPCHKMTEVMERLARAARRGAKEYCLLRQVPFEENMIETTFDRLHNDAYADSPDSAPMQALKAAFDALGEAWPAPRAWETSCDARIYHHRGHAVAIIGAGALEACHSEQEYVEIPDVQKLSALITLATWGLTG